MKKLDRRGCVAVVLLGLLWVSTGCQGPGDSAPADPEDALMQQSQALASTYPLKVFFSRSPESFGLPTAVFPVDRVSTTIGLGTFAVQLLIAGPTTSERGSGYFSELNSILTGPSACSAPLPTGGPDFRLTLNRRGPRPEDGTATVQFCRESEPRGVESDARIIAEISTTLRQFPSIRRVVVLTLAGHCFGDGSGVDLCLR